MRAVVTGGAGFIGSHVVDAVVRAGGDVLVLDDLSHGSEANLAGAGAVELVRTDIRDVAAVTEAFRRFGPDVAFHLAAQIDVRTSMAEPGTDAEVNVVGSVNVLSAAVAAGVRRVVNTSTGGAIYGETTLVPTPEDHPAQPLSAYGLGKHTVERYAAWFRATHGLEVVTLRYGNVYGPRQDPAGDAGVIAIFCARLLSGSTPTVFGDGRQTRDYVFVGDIVRANLAAATAPSLAHDVYNVGTGIEVSVLDLASVLAEVGGVAPESFTPEHRPARTGEIVRSCLDVSRARKDLGLADPTPLAEGLRATLDWLRARGVLPSAVAATPRP